MKVFKQPISIPTPELLAHLTEKYPPSIWLDSALSTHPRSHYSLWLAQPLASVTIDAQGSGELALLSGKKQKLMAAYAYLEEWVQTFHSLLRVEEAFCGGVVGFVTYESYAGHSKLVPRFRYSSLPDAFFLLVDTAVVVDQKEGRAWIFSLGLCDDLKTQDEDLARQRISRIQDLLTEQPSMAVSKWDRLSLSSNISRDQYVHKVCQIQEAIRRGDCYQVNFSQRFSAQGPFTPSDLYLRLRQSSPAPQMAFCNLGENQILSSSPEILFESHQKEIRSYPIKGTSHRGRNKEEDDTLQMNLLASAKDNAELLMIVDLVRNDLGKFCELGSIDVPSLKSLETFHHVHHLVACVQGEMPDPPVPFRALRELFPGGSITGAPKLKAMEMISKLEETPRGIYTGSIGYAGFNGQACFNIAIRTALLENESLYYWAGGGIVVDSDPEAEYEESLYKAKGFFEALGVEYGGG